MSETAAMLEALAVRCKTATEADRMLDADIFLETGEFARRRITDARMLNRDYVRRLAAVYGVPGFTSSIDAAISLIPEGCYWHIGHGRTRADEPLGGAAICAPGSIEALAEAEGATVALAICAAALMLRAFHAADRTPLITMPAKGRA
ncbi:hypothetical protein [Bradyrhizobium cosmicum]|uniref:Uncharacterized protein n=1 Tax=Bradyrhizobium cosmicum TaxID=1404864 RepID=A0AAI8MDJ6_9BRAD|nr:hypothetical protein [Bradyrhizobium cosmicum]BAL75978.1 hypothetical protein S23_27660 [Bradyrhizobium cosmicum]